MLWRFVQTLFVHILLEIITENNIKKDDIKREILKNNGNN